MIARLSALPQTHVGIGRTITIKSNVNVDNNNHCGRLCNNKTSNELQQQLLTSTGVLIEKRR